MLSTPSTNYLVGVNEDHSLELLNHPNFVLAKKQAQGAI